MADGGNQLPLVQQVHIAAQRRGAPGVAGYAQAGMRQRLGAHAHLDAGCQRRLAAVNAGNAAIGQQLAPVVVHQNHGLGHHQVQRRAALTDLDLHGFAAVRRRFLERIVAQQAEVEIRAGKGFGFAAHDFALRLQMLRQTPQKAQCRAVRLQLRLRLGRVSGGCQPFGRGHGFELVQPQVVHDRHAFDAVFRALQLQRGLVEGGVEGQGGARLAGAQSVVLHHLMRQHGDLVARHVDRGHALARHRVDGIARLHGQARRRNVDAQCDRATAEAAHGQRVVDLGGAGIVDGEGLHLGQRQFGIIDARSLQRRKARTLGEVLEQEALPVELVG